MKTSNELDKNPFITKVTDDIYKLSVHFPYGMYHVNSYLFKGEKGYTVIDTGPNVKDSINIWNQVLSLGIVIEKIVLTHIHQDHLGLSRWFQENYQVPVLLSDIGYREMLKIRSYGDGNWICNLIKQHGGPDFPVELMSIGLSSYQFEPDGLFEIDQKIQLGNQPYEVIWTPGHAPDHCCFYNSRQKIMVVGDLVLDEITPIIGVSSDDGQNTLKDYFDSLDRVSSYSISLSLTGHGEIIEDLPKRIDEIKSSHNRRLQQILESVRNKEKTAFQVCEEIYGKLGFRKIFFPLVATITRLIYLESLGNVTSKMENGKYYYRLNR